MDASSRSTCSCCWSTSSTPATSRRPSSTGPARSCGPGAAGSRSTPCRGRPRDSSSTSPGKQGLVRRTGNDSGSMLRYLDTTPIAEQLERAMHALRQSEADRPGPAGADQPAAHRRSWKRCARRSRRTSTPTCAAIRGWRCRWPARVRVGLVADLPRPRGEGRSTTPPIRDGGEQIEVYAVADAPRVRRPRPTSTTRSRRRSRRSPTRCGRSRTAASRACASPPRAASARPDARRAGRRPPVGRLRLGAGRRAPAQQAVQRRGRGRRVDHRRAPGGAARRTRGARRGRPGHRRQRRRHVDHRRALRRPLPAAAVASRQAARREDADRADVTNTARAARSS